MRALIFILFCTVGIFAFLDSCSAAHPGQFEIGARPYADKLFAREEIRKFPGGSYRTVSEERTFTTDGKARITMIRATDVKKNGANVRLLSGGPGHSYVTLEFTSAVGQGLHYMFEMYARY